MANSGGVTLYHCSESNLSVISSLDQQEISLSIDWTQHKYVLKLIHSLSSFTAILYIVNCFRDIVVSDSSGKISKYCVNQDKLVKLTSWSAHDHEAWIVACDKWNSHVIYSGTSIVSKKLLHFCSTYSKLPGAHLG